MHTLEISYNVYIVTRNDCVAVAMLRPVFSSRFYTFLSHTPPVWLAAAGVNSHTKLQLSTVPFIAFSPSEDISFFAQMKLISLPIRILLQCPRIARNRRKAIHTEGLSVKLWRRLYVDSSTTVHLACSRDKAVCCPYKIILSTITF